jgi:hypothetical protein
MDGTVAVIIILLLVISVGGIILLGLYLGGVFNKQKTPPASITENKRKLYDFFSGGNANCDTSIFNDVVNWFDAHGAITVPLNSPCPSGLKSWAGSTNYMACVPNDFQNPPEDVSRVIFVNPCQTHSPSPVR